MDKSQGQSDQGNAYLPFEWLRPADRHMSTDTRRQQLIAILERQTRACRQLTGTNVNVLYGQPYLDELGGDEAFDWFTPNNLTQAPIKLLVYLHGGYWQRVTLNQASHWAKPVVEKGLMFAALHYRLAPWQSLYGMPQRLCLAMQRVYLHTVESLSSEDAKGLEIVLVGHSAGAQLAIETVSRAMSANEQQNSDWLSSLRGIIGLSGIYDVRPIVDTPMNKALDLKSEQEAWAVSPIRNLSGSNQALQSRLLSLNWLIAWAEFDPPGLIKQSQVMYEQLCGIKASVATTASRIQALCVQGDDHFSSIEQLFYGARSSTLFEELMKFLEC